MTFSLCAPGVAILPPLQHPGPHQHIIGYELFPARVSFLWVILLLAAVRDFHLQYAASQLRRSIVLTQRVWWVQANCSCEGFSVMGVVSIIILLCVFWCAALLNPLLSTDASANGFPALH